MSSFDTIDHGWLLRFLEHRIADRRVLRLIRKWLGAGVIEDGTWAACDEGTPQGASISTLLANVYLHYVFDLWVHQWRRRKARGHAVVTRFADDFVVGFEFRRDARWFLAELRERFARFGLELHPEKTRLIEFGRFAADRRRMRGRRAETFEFLGFTHMCAKTRDGRFKLTRITSKKRMRAKLREVKIELRRRRHLPISEQGRWLASVVRGHLAYYAVPDNALTIRAFRARVIWHWRKALRHRSQRTNLTWKRMSVWRIDGSPSPAPCIQDLPCASTLGPKAGAQCAKRARWDLCGGPPARAVPTANVRAWEQVLAWD